MTAVATDSLDNPYFMGMCSPSATTFYGLNDSVPITGLKTFVTKYDKIGNLNWISGGGQSSYPQDFCMDKHGNCFITGYFWGTTSFGIGNDTLQGTSFESGDAFLVKLNSDGQPMFFDVFGDTCGDQGTAVISLTSDDIITYGLDGKTCVPYNSESVGYIKKFSPIGMQLWSIKLPIASGFIYISDKTITPDGGFLISGIYNSYSSLSIEGTTDTIYLPPCMGGSDCFIIKYSSSGEARWVKTIKGYAYEFPRCITSDSSGNIILAMFSSGTCYFDSLTLLPKSTYTFHLIKTDSTGNLLKYLSVPNGGSNSRFVVDDLKTDLYGNIYLLARTDSVVVIGTDTLHFNLPTNRTTLALIKLDPNLKYLWSQYIVGTANDGGKIAVTDSIIYIGMHFETIATLNGSSFQFQATNWPNSDSFISAIKNDNSPLSSGEVEIDKFPIKVFPNPTSGIFTVQMHNYQAGAKVTVRDVLGNCLLEKNCIGETSQEIDLSRQPRGIYFVELLSGEERIVRKVAVQ